MFELIGAVGTEQSVRTDFDEAARQDVQEESADELLGAQHDALELLAAVVPVTESHPALVEVFDPAMGDGNAKHIASQIVQDLLPLAGVLAMNDPVLLPDCGGDLSEQTEFSEAGPEFAPKDFTQSEAGNQEGGMARGDPVLLILGQAAAAEQAMPAPTALRAKRIGSRPRLVQVCKTASIARRPPTYWGSQASFCKAAAALWSSRP